jgi:cytidylate kinase
MPVRVTAIDGHGGAGKSTLADRIATALGDAPIVHNQSFVRAIGTEREDSAIVGAVIGLTDLIDRPTIAVARSLHVGAMQPVFPSETNRRSQRPTSECVAAL